MKLCFDFRKIFFLALELLIINSSLLISEIRYVSKTGSSIPPYTSWATASDSIQKCINICQSGDTVYVANGIYREKIKFFYSSITLLGSSMDSCIINTQTLVTPSDFYAVSLNEDCEIKFFRIIVDNYNPPIALHGSAIGCYNANGAKIQYNRIEGCVYGIAVGFSVIMAENNLIENSEYGMDFTDWDAQPRSWVSKNIFRNIHNIGILVHQGAEPLIINNTFYSEKRYFIAFSGGGSDSAFFIGNLVVSPIAERPIANAILPTITQNNTIVSDKMNPGLLAPNYSDIRNNTFTNGLVGLEVFAGHAPVIKYNNSWDNQQNYKGFTPDSTNIAADPMFVNPDSNDFHLEMYSHLIDRGDPAILDVNGTRSDIGYYGGPYGESYTYKDYAPKPPRGLKLYYYDGVLSLIWKKSEEADFKEYYLYRDTIPNFTLDSSTFLKKLNVEYFVDTPAASISKYYFRLMAADSQGNVSKPSEEIGIILTSIKGEEPIVIQDYALYPNYPNPFNSSTVIPFRLKVKSYVKLTVFDLRGKIVKTVMNDYLETGYHEAEFSSKTEDGDIASGIYFYRIEVIDENRRIVFIDIKKMVQLR